MYQVSIKANNGPAHDVTVEVTDVDEPGTVSLDKPQPQVGRSIAAVDFDDPDGTNDKSVAWYSGPSDGRVHGRILKSRTSPTRRTRMTRGMYLQVVYTYNDRHGDGKTAEDVSDNPVEARTVSNSAPDFGDIDDDLGEREHGRRHR